MRILHIIPYFGPAFAYGGTIRAAYDLAVRLAERGHDQMILTTDALDAENRLPAGPAEVEGIPVQRVRNLSNRLAWSRIFIPLGFRRAVRNAINDYDVVHLHEVRSLLNAAALPHLRDTPYIMTPQGGLPRELRRAGYKRVFDALFGERLLQGAAWLHALTEMERQQYLALGLPEEKIFISPNGIDTTEFEFEADVPGFKRKYGIPQGRPVVGFLARLNPIKGADFLIDAFAHVQHTIPEAVLMLVGPDDGARPALEAQVARLGLGASVIFTGFIGGLEEKAAAYRAADVYILSSRYDIQGITPLEALLNRTPTIVTERCGLATYFAEQDIAGVVPFGDEEALAAAIVERLQHPEAARQQAERGKAQITADFNWQTLVDGWETVYRNAGRS